MNCESDNYKLFLEQYYFITRNTYNDVKYYIIVYKLKKIFGKVIYENNYIYLICQTEPKGLYITILGNSFANNFENIYYPAEYVPFHIYGPLYVHTLLILKVNLLL